MGQNLVLVCQTHKLPESRIRLGAGTLVVGRSSNCGVHVPDPTVSRRHAEITVSDGGVRVVDLESRNGTFVDEMPVETSPLRLGQELRFGAVSFRLTDCPDDDLNVESEIETREAPNGKLVSLTDPTVVALSPAQRRVFDLLLDGLAEKEVAYRLDLSQHTVHNHTREIYRVFRVHSRAELFARLLPKA